MTTINIRTDEKQLAATAILNHMERIVVPLAFLQQVIITKAFLSYSNG